MKIHFTASNSERSLVALKTMTGLYGQCQKDHADCIVVLSGDGMVLRAFHENEMSNIPVYGLNRGGVGFLTNTYSTENLIERIQNTEKLIFNPLKVEAERENGEKFTSLAINEVYLLRETHQTAKIKISINEELKMEELICDGIIAASPIGSAAYNYSADGPILPIGSNLIALTPISAFRPRAWKGALINANSTLTFNVIDYIRRPVCAVADYVEFRGVSKVCVSVDYEKQLTLLFDKDQTLEKKILNEQFAT